MIMAYVGSASLGVIVGWLIWTFVQRSTTLTVQTITSLASLAAGGVVIAAASWGATTRAGDTVYVYPVGALIAIVLLGLLKFDPSSQSH